LPRIFDTIAKCPFENEMKAGEVRWFHTHTARWHGTATSTTLTYNLPPTRDLRLHPPMVTILGQLREEDHHPPNLHGFVSRLESQVRMEAAEQLGVVIHLSPPHLNHIAQQDDCTRWTHM